MEARTTRRTEDHPDAPRPVRTTETRHHSQRSQGSHDAASTPPQALDRLNKVTQHAGHAAVIANPLAVQRCTT